MNIHFTRNSVCMGDDCFDNSRDYSFNPDAKWSDILPIIIKNDFLPSIHGNDVVWVLHNSEHEEILSYFTKTNTIIKCTNKVLLSEICNGINKLHFKYYSSRQSRGEYIEKVNGYSQYNMWHEGWLEEYKLCK